jgi:hypothetical protein
MGSFSLLQSFHYRASGKVTMNNCVGALQRITQIGIFWVNGLRTEDKVPALVPAEDVKTYREVILPALAVADATGRKCERHDPSEDLEDDTEAMHPFTRRSFPRNRSCGSRWDC